MESPSSVNDYFDVVDDFFEKKFREEKTFRLAFKAKRPVEIIEKKVVDKKGGDAKVEESKPVATSFIKLAPVVSINRDGSTSGRLKVGSNIDIGDYCTLYQRCGIDTEGKVTVKGDLDGMLEGLELKAKIEVNTLAPAGEDVVEFESGYQLNDVYVSGAIAKAGNGDQGITFDLGTKVSNAIIGIGISRDIHLDDADHVMYLGAGFCGDNWSVAGKVTRENNEWNSVDVAVTQFLTTTEDDPYPPQVCARINLDIPTETTLMDIGISQPVDISGLGKTSFSFLNEWFGNRLQASLKLASSGMLCTLLGFKYRDNLNVGISARWHLLDTPMAPARYGIQLSLEDE